MSAALTISDVGLRLIKAYEGFRPVDVELVSGQRVAGYGHRVMTGESLYLTERKAEKLLKRDLAPYEAMINDSIFAPLTQSQFDALCSLAFNIGPKKFLESDVVRAINNGRVLDAANGFDVWRKGKVNGESYVVDALVRRRTAEKVLFLRPALKAIRAPRVELEATADKGIEGLTTAAADRIFEDSGLVPAVNYDAANVGEPDIADVSDANEVKDALLKPNADLIDVLKDMFVERRDPEADIPAAATPMRRRDDRPGGVLTLSEVFDDEPEVSGVEDDFAKELSSENDESEPLIKDLEGFTLDIETEAETDLNVVKLNQDMAKDTGLELIDLDDQNEGTVLEMEMSDVDPSTYIVGVDNSADTVDDSEIDLPPSPIATAAAEVSDRLDALMAQADGNEIKPDNKVLPFRAKKLANEGIAKTPHSMDDGLASVNSERDDTSLSETSSSKLDELVEDAKSNAEKKAAEQKDSASRYIASRIAPAKSKSPHIALNLLVVFGMVLLAVSVATMLSGFDSRFGVGGEFLSTVGALLGLMITLGSIYYSFKNRVQTA